jgi:hypothetical protein
MDSVDGFVGKENGRAICIRVATGATGGQHLRYMVLDSQSRG